MKLKIGNINIKTVAAWIFLPTFLVIAYYAAMATQINQFTLTLEDNQTLKNQFIDDFYLPNRHIKTIEVDGETVITKSMISYFKLVHFLTKTGITYDVKRITEGEYQKISVA